MADPLPAVPQWFATASFVWQPYEQFRGVLGATMRKKQLERLKESHGLEFVCRTYGPGVVKLWARVRHEDEDPL